MNVYIGKDGQRAAQRLTATHSTVNNLTRGVEGFGHKQYMDNLFSSPELSDDVAQKKYFLSWEYETTQKGHAQGPQTQDTQTETW